TKPTSCRLRTRVAAAVYLITSVFLGRKRANALARVSTMYCVRYKRHAIHFGTADISSLHAQSLSLRNAQKAKPTRLGELRKRPILAALTDASSSGWDSTS